MSGRIIHYGYLKKRIDSGTLPDWLVKHPRKTYILRCAQSTPAWANKKEMNKLAKQADEKTMLTGRPHVLDHIIPLAHPMVCGLTVHNNLRVMDKLANQKKSNCLNGELDLLGQLSLI